MEWTWTEIISLALVQSGVLGLGQPVSASQSAYGLKRLNLLLDELDGEGLALPAFDSAIIFNTLVGQAKYLLGPGGGAAYTVRPEQIITGTCTITSNPIVRNQLVPIAYADYTLIPVPSNGGQPWNYSVNQKWPQMELFLYPVPSAIYPITLNCKVKWISTVGSPDLNPFTVAEVPSGYANGLVDILALKMAEPYRLDTDTLRLKAANARFMMTSMVYNQARSIQQTMPIGLFPWQIGITGRNPW